MAYDKKYDCKNNQGANQTSVKAVLYGMEEISAHYCSRPSWVYTEGQVIVNGQTCRTLTFSDPSGVGVAPNGLVVIAWSAKDGGCSTRDLRWYPSGAAVFSGGAYGGGLAFYKYGALVPDLVFFITNDNLPDYPPLDFSDVRYRVYSEALDLGQLAPLENAEDKVPGHVTEGPVLDLPPFDPGTVLSLPGRDPGKYRPWPPPGNVLAPGEYSAFAVPNVDQGAGFVLLRPLAGGKLDWLEQAVAETAPWGNDAPRIAHATATPNNLWPAYGAMVHIQLNVQVTHSRDSDWYVEEITSDKPGTDLWQLDDLQKLYLRADTGRGDPRRAYTITLRAIDEAGNVSEPYTLEVTVHSRSGG